MSSLVVTGADFQHILRVLNTNIDGRQKVMFAMTRIRGVGRRFANVVLKKAEVNLDKRAGELSAEEVERIVTIIQNPRQFKIPDWFLNRKKDNKDGKFSQICANNLDLKLREDLERLKKIRAHRGLRHYWGLRVRGQHTKTTGRKGRTVGVSKKKGGKPRAGPACAGGGSRAAVRDLQQLVRQACTAGPARRSARGPALPPQMWGRASRRTWAAIPAAADCHVGAGQQVSVRRAVCRRCARLAANQPFAAAGGGRGVRRMAESPSANQCAPPYDVRGAAGPAVPQSRAVPILTQLAAGGAV
eukprot:CAMPEP_0206035560 /NCGR_PEP_ID=MMETSP1466-20131121/2165_1 /ASSEMBLY_ACC=CAM_ASM_001126 /TAXON_ID=44452 /ORGANISM="Pavlova gyrans, Strain CCMP608" /LENGTH=300 /DNA_ID=CAMNT_0053409947 /DNA_START=46 /DNA_END=953 /DNA_ORIENTATION=-